MVTKRLQNTSQKTQNNIESIFLVYYLNSSITTQEQFQFIIKSAIQTCNPDGNL